MSLSKNQNVELYIDSFTSEGSGVGRYENMAVFVSGAAAFIPEKSALSLDGIPTERASEKCLCRHPTPER